jgi:partner of Y14 and mago protein
LAARLTVFFLFTNYFQCVPLLLTIPPAPISSPLVSSNMTTPDSISKSGITTDAATGERYIPSSVRADGSKRREIRVRPGYKPPEDVELYKNRAAAAWKTRGGKGGVPGADGLSSEDDKKAAQSSGTAASNKNAKRREARKKAKAEGEDGEGVKKGAESENWRAPAPAPVETKQESAVDAEAEKEKKARNLRKKLRQARDLRDKKNQGEALLPEQLEKVIKIQELVRQLSALGVGVNGDKEGDAKESV